MECDNKSLEELNHQLIQEKEAKDKEIKKIRQSLEVKESTLDEYRYDMRYREEVFRRPVCSQGLCLYCHLVRRLLQWRGSRNR